jgi:RNA polymerase sigma-70 factor (ECF subfamily)
MNEQVAEVAAQARRELSGRVLAATLRSVRDLDIAEESTADAFMLALQS